MCQNGETSRYAVKAIGVTSYGGGALVPTPLELAHVHQSGNFYVRITSVGSGGLLVNTTLFSVPATDSQSLKFF